MKHYTQCFILDTFLNGLCRDGQKNEGMLGVLPCTPRPSAEISWTSWCWGSAGDAWHWKNKHDLSVRTRFLWHVRFADFLPEYWTVNGHHNVVIIHLLQEGRDTCGKDQKVYSWDGPWYLRQRSRKYIPRLGRDTCGKHPESFSSYCIRSIINLLPNHSTIFYFTLRPHPYQEG